MAKKKVEFTVEGSDNFPLDMLRYDACYPVGSESIDGMLFSANPRLRSIYAEDGRKFQVILRSEHEPTDGRWESFGWKVINKKKV